MCEGSSDMAGQGHESGGGQAKLVGPEGKGMQPRPCKQPVLRQLSK